MEYHDLSDPGVGVKFPEVLEFVERNRYLLPVVTLDGEVVSVGYISYWLLVDAVDERLKAAGSRTAP